MTLLHLTVDELLALQELNRLRVANDQALKALHDDAPDTLAGKTADLLRDIANYAASVAPFLTGTLRSAHRGELIDVQPEHVVGLVYIDPNVVNPVFGGFPAQYGIEVHQRKPWMDWTVQYAEANLLPALDESILFTITRGFE